MEVNRITGEIVDAAVKVHHELGPGLLESVYEVVLTAELQKRGLRARRQVPVSFEFDNMIFTDAYKIDILVQETVIVEVKSLEAIAPVHPKQVLTYLRLTDLRVGLLLNFGAATMKEGIQRIVNGYEKGLDLRQEETS